MAQLAEIYTKEEIILRLKTLNTELRQCQSYNDVDLCRQRLLVTISKIPSLNELYNSKITEIKQIIKRDECKILIDNLLELVTQKNNLDSYIAGDKIKTNSGSKLFEYNQNLVVDIPNLLFFPSLALIHATDDFFPNDYQKRDEELSTLYYKFGASFSKIFLKFRFKEIYLELPLIKSEKYSAVNFKNFHTAFLYAVTYRTNLVLQDLIKAIRDNDKQQSCSSKTKTYRKINVHYNHRNKELTIGNNPPLNIENNGVITDILDTVLGYKMGTGNKVQATKANKPRITRFNKQYFQSFEVQFLRTRNHFCEINEDNINITHE